MEIKLSLEKDFNRLYKSKNTFPLKDGDIITITSRPNIVEIIGEVNAPGFYQYQNRTKLNDYIKICGGLKPSANRKKSYILYPNGQSVPIGRFSNPKIFDGSKIYINKKEEVENFKLSTYLTEITTTYSQIVQSYMLLKLLTRDLSQ